VTRQIEMPEERNVVGDRPRIGVFVCQCGINISGVVDIASVREYAKGLPYVTYVEDNLYTCSQDTQVKMAEVIREKGINRVVVASCSPKTHEGLFQETLQNAGLNKYLFEMANIRNQDSWVHSKEPVSATEKAKDLVRMAVAKVGLLEPLQETELNMDPAGLVIGGGMAGMAAAKNLATQGYEVHLVERSDTLGGQARSLHQTWRGKPISEHLNRMIADVENNPRIHVHLLSGITHVDGFVGNFSSVVRQETGKEVTITHGIAVVATGAKEFQTDEYLHGKDPRVLTHQALDGLLRSEDPWLNGIRSAAFIQCVGSREPERPYCSRVCCTHTLRSALQLKAQQPDMAIYVLYRDLRTYGEREDLYHEARRKGVVFIRYDLAHKPKIDAKKEALEIEAWDPVLQNSILIRADLLALATAIVPEDNQALAQFFKLPVGEDGFFLEAHAKLRPVDFSTDGVFLCGMAHYPKSVDESIAQALAASARAATFLASDSVHVGGTVAEVRGQLCSRCGVCIDICSFKAPFFTEEGPAAVNAALCKGCGLCVSSCRSGALHLKGFDDDQMLAMIQEC
jgi:heterodisulfide reductase subunit A